MMPVWSPAGLRPCLLICWLVTSALPGIVCAIPSAAAGVLGWLDFGGIGPISADSLCCSSDLGGLYPSL